MDWHDIASGTLYGVNAHRLINNDFSDTVFVSFQIDDRVYRFSELPGYMWHGEYSNGYTRKAWGDFEPIRVECIQRIPSAENIQDGVIIKHNGNTIISIGRHHGESMPALLVNEFDKMTYKRSAKKCQKT